MRNKRWLFLLLAAFLLIGGCGISNVEKGEREAVEYTVLRPDAIPPEVAEVIQEQGDAAFQMTYISSGYLLYPAGLWAPEIRSRALRPGGGGDFHGRSYPCPDLPDGAGDGGRAERRRLYAVSGHQN